MNEIQTLIAALHDTPRQIVISFAGAGSQALAWLHSVGGSSRTVLESTDHYSPRSLSDLIGTPPSQFASPQVANTMATRAYLRACELSDPGTPVAGIGCTATIATDRKKRGNHRVCVSACTETGVLTYGLTMTKGRRSRQDEERLVSLLLLRIIAAVSQVPFDLSLPLLKGETVHDSQRHADLVERLLGGEFELVMAHPDGYFIPQRQRTGEIILSGSFNPLHNGHLELARTVSEKLGQSVSFELPLINADKAPIDSAEVYRRTAQFFQDDQHLFLTRAPLFNQKAQLFPRSTFVIGVDTADRLVQPRFYQDSIAKMAKAFDEIRTAGCRFLVAGRLRGERFLTLRDLELPPGYSEMFQEIPEAVVLVRLIVAVGRSVSIIL